ncbi:MAG TPA: metallophosphoesterase family protein [bacterium]|nr:metallophosphoesterase family protein [bacterium]HOM26390.1 metallophosphoesterase family protein [bacterium]
MKIAITSDVHLKNCSESPERYNALENIFSKITHKGISELIIAGDLFDKDYNNYSDFDELCKKYPNVSVSIIPGNHDYKIENRFFAATNIKVITEPQIKEIDGLPILFLPYNPEKSMDEVIVEFSHRNTFPERWILIGHGDYITINKELNPYEPGFYMPLTAMTVNNYNPAKVILGHIHKHSEFGKVVYPGSPCGLDINETGKRRFLIYDTQSLVLEYETVETDVIYFNETILMYPMDDEISYLKDRFYEIIQKWQLSEDELKKVKLRLFLKGYTKDKNVITQNLVQIVRDKGIEFYDSSGPDTSELKILKETDRERILLLNKVKIKIENIVKSIDKRECVSSTDDIMKKVMELIFRSENK